MTSELIQYIERQGIQRPETYAELLEIERRAQSIMESGDAGRAERINEYCSHFVIYVLKGSDVEFVDDDLQRIASRPNLDRVHAFGFWLEPKASELRTGGFTDEVLVWSESGSTATVTPLSASERIYESKDEAKFQAIIRGVQYVRR